MARLGGPRLGSQAAAANAGPAHPAAWSYDSPRLDSLTGLRFFAALAVVGVHYYEIFYWHSPALRTAPKIFEQGGSGVSFFFILSGFVLTWSHRPGDRPRPFLRRRLARIGPLHLVTSALFVVLTLAILPWPGIGRAAESVALLAPWSPGWSANQALNVPAWSLGCELFFYLMFPVLYPALSRLGSAPRRTIALACMAGPILIAAAVGAGGGQTRITHWLFYFFPPTRLLEFVLGMVLALEMRQGRLPRVGLIPATALAGIAYIGAGQTPGVFQQVAVTVVPFAILIVGAAQADMARRASIYRLPALVTLGVWSFALYLGHLAVLDVMFHFVHHNLSSGGTVGLGLGFLATSLLLAGALHAAIERPLEARLRAAPPRPEAEPHPVVALP